MSDDLSRSSLNSRLPWGCVVGFWLALIILTGGLTTPSPLALTFQFGVSAILVILSCWRLRHGLPNRFSLFGWLLLLSAFLLVCAQIVPLPPDLWKKLSGRQLISDTLTLTGGELPWLPLTLTPSETRWTLVSMVPVFAGFLAALSLKGRDMFMIAVAVISLAIFSVILGLLQKSGQVPDWMYFYGKPISLTATGPFGNRNFLAVQLFSSLPFLAVLAISIQRRTGMRSLLILGFVLVYMAIMLAGLASVGSRGGVLLAMPAVFLTLLFVYKTPPEIGRMQRSGFAIMGVIGGIMVISQASMLGILRLVEKDPLADFRSTIFGITWAAAKSFWPAGSGFGSFVPVYQIYETPNAILDRYVNAAHNDWLQLLLEGGLAAGILCTGFILMYLYAVWRALNHNVAADDFSTTVRASIVVVLLMAIHAIFDFGLRTPALLAIFSLSCGLICRSGRYGNIPQKTAQPDSVPYAQSELKQNPVKPRTHPFFKQPPTQ
jgi:O-antigen ligase